MRRLGWLWLAGLAACTIAPADAGTRETPDHFREVAIARIGVGAGAERISKTGCRLCTGAPFLGRKGTVYFYDTRQNNLKVLSKSGDSVRVATDKVYELLDIVGEAELDARRIERASVVLDAIGKERESFVFTEIFKRQNRDGFLRNSCSRFILKARPRLRLRYGSRRSIDRSVAAEKEQSD